MSERPITKQELAEVHRYRIGKPATRVAGKAGWRDPSCCVKFLGEIIERERKKMWKTDKRRAD